MKAYKATYNLKCRDMTYKVGNTYTFDGMIQMCHSGYHFCEDMEDTLNYYNFTNEFVLLEVEILGSTIFGRDKGVTNKLKVLRIVPEEEYTFKANKYIFDDKDRLIEKIYATGPHRKVIYTYEGDCTINPIVTIYNRDGSHHATYDEKSRLILKTFSDGSQIAYTYNKNGSYTSTNIPANALQN